MAEEMQLIFVCFAFFAKIMGLDAQYYHIQKGSSPIPSAPVSDSSNTFVFTSSGAQNEPNQFIPQIGEISEPTLNRNDANQQRVQLSPPAGLLAYESAQPLPVNNENPHRFNEPTPAPEYGPPADTDVSKISPEDYLIFVPAFPSDSSSFGGGLSEAAPPAPVSNTGFIPPDGALLSPPAPVVDGKPLPSHRNPFFRHLYKK